jgi:hypothetical protein
MKIGRSSSAARGGSISILPGLTQERLAEFKFQERTFQDCAQGGGAATKLNFSG